MEGAVCDFQSLLNWRANLMDGGESDGVCGL